jgi:hypothetical protein
MPYINMTRTLSMYQDMDEYNAAYRQYAHRARVKATEEFTMLTPDGIRVTYEGVVQVCNAAGASFIIMYEVSGDVYDELVTHKMMVKPAA